MALAAPTQAASYNQSGTYKLDLSPVLSAILLDDTDFLSMIGISGDVATQTKHQWDEDALNATTIVQTGGNSYLSGVTAVKIVFSSNISRITAGTLMRDAISGNTEVVQVTLISGISATVTRGFATTSAAAHASGATWQIVANPRPQGMTGPKDESTTRSRAFNYTQIISKGVQLTGTAIAIQHNGISSEDAYQIDLRLREAKRELNRTCLMGMRGGDASSTVYTTMGGMIYWTTIANTSNWVKTAETLTPSVLNSLIKKCWDLGLYPDSVLVGGVQKQKISTFDQEFRRSTLDTTRSGYTVEEFVSDLGINLRIYVDRWMPNDTIIVFERSRLKIMALQGRAFFLEKLAKIGDAELWQIVGEYTMEFRNANAAAAHTNLKQ